jgi:diadenosine tetraphosphate (Ap4A) HIT family hydrolase
VHADDCFLCRKHAEAEPQPPGGYIYQDADWLICHAPVDRGPLGTLFIESRRHFLDFADFNHREVAGFAPVVRLVFGVLRAEVHPQRIYLLSMMEGIPHFHAWIVPRGPAETARGAAFLAANLTCSVADAEDLVVRMRARINTQWSAS